MKKNHHYTIAFQIVLPNPICYKLNSTVNIVNIVVLDQLDLILALELAFKKVHPCLCLMDFEYPHML